MQAVIDHLEHAEKGVWVHVPVEKDGKTYVNKYFVAKFKTGPYGDAQRAGEGGTISFDLVANGKYTNMENLAFVSAGAGGPAAGAPSSANTGGPAQIATPADAAPVGDGRSRAEMIRCAALKMSVGFFQMCATAGIVKAAKNSSALMSDPVMDKAEEFIQYIQFGGIGDAVESSAKDLVVPDGSANTGEPAGPAPGDDDIPF